MREVANYLSIALKDAHDQAERRKAEHALRRSEKRLRYQANHDLLTGLANRGLLIQRLNRTLACAQEDHQRRFALLFLDLDRFKVINDGMGHAMGDRLLRTVGERLCANLRRNDVVAAVGQEHVLAARLGGDEFVVLLEDISCVQAAESLADRLRRAVGAPYEIDGQDLTPTVSIGIVVGDHRYGSAEEVLCDADTAMYEAKANGRARHMFFDREMHEQMRGG